jgi:hypothetical protein
MNMRLGALAFAVAGAAWVSVEGTAMAQGSTTPQSQSMGGSRSGSAIESNQASGATSDGTVSAPGQKRSFDHGFTSQPPGIGEKGSGQTQSTLERSGGQQSGSPPMSQSSQELKEGKTAQAMEEQSQEVRNR